MKNIYIYCEEFFNSNNGAVIGLINYLEILNKLDNISIYLIYNSSKKRLFERKISNISTLEIQHKKIFGFWLSINFFNKLEISKNDLIIFNSIYSISSYLISRKASKMSINYIIISHGGYLKKNINKNLLVKKIWHFFIENKYIKLSKYLITHFSQESNDLKEFTKMNIKSMNIPFGLNNFINFNTYKKRNLISYFGRASIYHKGLDIFLDALKASKTIHNFDVRLYVQDHKVKDIEYLRKRIKELKRNYDINIELKNPLYGESKVKILKKTLISLFPSRYEGFGLSLMEAMSYNILCLVSEEHQISGYLKKFNVAYVLKNKPKNYSLYIDDIFNNHNKKLSDKNIFFSNFNDEECKKKWKKVIF